MPKRERIPEAEKIRLILLAAGMKNPKVEYIPAKLGWELSGEAFLSERVEDRNGGEEITRKEGFFVLIFKSLQEARQIAIQFFRKVAPELLEGPRQNPRLRPGVLESIAAWEKNPNLEIKADEEARGGGLDRYRARKVQVKLAFLDWRKKGESVYNTPEGLELSTGDFHSGTTFSGEIHLPPEEARELKEAIRAGYQPCFWLFLEE